MDIWGLTRGGRDRSPRDLQVGWRILRFCGLFRCILERSQELDFRQGRSKRSDLSSNTVEFSSEQDTCGTRTCGLIDSPNKTQKHGNGIGYRSKWCVRTAVKRNLQDTNCFRSPSQQNKRSHFIMTSKRAPLGTTSKRLTLKSPKTWGQNKHMSSNRGKWTKTLSSLTAYSLQHKPENQTHNESRKYNSSEQALF